MTQLSKKVISHFGLQERKFSWLFPEFRILGSVTQNKIMSFLKTLCLFVLAVTIIAIVTLHQTFLVNTLELQPILLTGKTAIVTGGTDGIGKVTARVLASWG